MSRSLAIGLVVFLASTGIVLGHASEQGFVLLLPTDFYVAAGTAAVCASMVLVTCTPERLLALLFRPRRFLTYSEPRGLQNATSILSTLAFFCLIYIGFFGPHDPQDNLLPLTIWTGFWVALYIVQGTVFDVWRWVNPWRGLHAVVMAGKTPIFAMRPSGPIWPALGGYALFQLFLMADIAPSDPERLALFALLYWLVTLVCMILFGGEAWLARGECFTVLFRLIGSLRLIIRGQVGCAGWSSIKQAPLHLSEAVFCLVILASGSFDGIRETFWWLGQIGINPLEFPGRSAVVWQSSLGLIATNVALIAAFAASLWIGLQLLRRFGTAGEFTLTAQFQVFSISILPIALGYHFAHYFVGFLVQIQYLAVAIGDPLLRGWNLFGWHDIRVTAGFLGDLATVKIIFMTQALVVVGSHIIAVLMAHHLSGRFAATARDKLLLQAGLTVLMVAYTIFGLWLLASPRGA